MKTVGLIPANAPSGNAPKQNANTERSPKTKEKK